MTGLSVRLRTERICLPDYSRAPLGECRERKAYGAMTVLNLVSRAQELEQYAVVGWWKSNKNYVIW